MQRARGLHAVCPTGNARGLIDPVVGAPERAFIEAIANAWIPFLIEGGATLVLTSAGVTMFSPDQGSSTATFAIRGQTRSGIRTVPGGTFAIAWKRINGAWKVSTLDGATSGNSKPARAGGVGGYRFGMSQVDLTSVADCAPYSNVSATGGIECPNYSFEGRTINVWLARELRADLAHG